MTQPESDVDLIAGVDEAISILGSRLLSELGSPSTEPGGLHIYAAEAMAEIASHRIHDVSSAAIDLFREQRIVPASTLTRASFETMAVFYYLLKKIRAASGREEMNQLKRILTRASWGSGSGSTNIKPIQVLTAVDHLDKEFTGLRGEYDMLCDFAHPSVHGMGGGYSKTDRETLEAVMGINPSALPLASFGLGHLLIVLECFDDFYRSWLAELPGFKKRLAQVAEECGGG